MQEVSFKCLFQNACYPARVSLESYNTMSVQIDEFSASFSPFNDSEKSDIYTISNTNFNLIYNKPTKMLTFRFSLKEMYSHGKALMQEVSNTVEKKINIFNFHAPLFSNRLEQVIDDLKDYYDISIQSLTHESSTVVIKSSRYVKITTKIIFKDEVYHPVLFSQPSLLTTQLYEVYFHMRCPVDLTEMYRALCLSCDAQIYIDEALSDYANLVGKYYKQGSYSVAGFTCIANSFNEIKVCYLNTYMIAIRVSNYQYTLEIADMAKISNRLWPIKKFNDYLHHLVTKSLEDPDLRGYTNTVKTNDRDILYQTLELHKAEHIKRALLFILNFISSMHALQSSSVYLTRILNEMYPESINSRVIILSDLEVCANLSTIKNFRFNFKLKLSNQEVTTGFILDVGLEIKAMPKKDLEKPRLEAIKTVYIEYFKQKIIPAYKVFTEILIGFIRSFLTPISFIRQVIGLMEEELVSNYFEILWHSYQVRIDQIDFLVRLWKENKFVDIKFGMRGESEIRTNLKPDFMLNVVGASPSISQIVQNLNVYTIEDLRNRLENN